MAKIEEHQGDRPYCKSCGYSLIGLTESSKCPECGQPIVDVLVRESFLGRQGFRYESDARLAGLPLVSIASGPRGSERRGKAVGIIAIGDMPRGVIAIGGYPFGVLSIGGVARGVVALGGVSLGIVGIGGVGIGVAAIGGLAVGLWAFGGMGIAFIDGVAGMLMKV